MKKHLSALLVLLGACMLCAGDFTLVKNGKAQCIVIPEKNSPREVYHAIYRFNGALQTITGAKLPITRW